MSTDPSAPNPARFYADIPAFERFDDVSNPAVYRRVPDDWIVLITDVRGSTRAIEAGRYKDVNALGVSIIAAVLNKLQGTDFPYVFGGDGATLVVPGIFREEICSAAQSAMALGRDAFGLELRAGVVPVSELSRAGHEVRVARFRVSRDVTLAMFEGGGLAHAEKLIKDPVIGATYALTAAAAPQDGIFDGFECRWNPIRARKDHILSLLVVARGEDDAEQRRVYRSALENIHRAAHLGEEGLRPVDVTNLSLAQRSSAFAAEARMRTGQASGLRPFLWRLKVRVLVAVATLFMKRGWALKTDQGLFNGATYKQEVAANTDFRKFDDTLRMVIDVSADELRDITAYLEGERAAGRLSYGMHTSDAALMTCVIKDFAGNHLHFVDGSNGGYALAARQLKEQLKSIQAASSPAA